jgi:ubiquitin-like-conjugating enzyme ATG3
MSSLLHAGANKLRRAREWATPTLKDSAFLKRGVLTPEEFVRAGDELVYKCPTWQWASGDPKKSKSYLPADKQFLITRNVPCPTRVSTLENSVAVGEEDIGRIEDECGGDDWIVSQILSPEEQQRRMDQKIEDEFDILDDEGETVKRNESMEDSMAKVTITESSEIMDKASKRSDERSATNDDDMDEYADLEEFEDENVLNDEAAITMDKSSFTKGNDDADDNLLKVRTYDLSITYDKYYQTPRVYIIGYSSQDSSQPLTADEMFQDVMSDYANRTVTIDPHPHVAGHYASIHPCQHGAVMKTIVKNLTKASAEGGSGKAPSVEMYLFIFLKFVSSIIPTINYDFTMDVTASTEKE